MSRHTYHFSYITWRFGFVEFGITELIRLLTVILKVRSWEIRLCLDLEGLNFPFIWKKEKFFSTFLFLSWGVWLLRPSPFPSGAGQCQSPWRRSSFRICYSHKMLYVQCRCHCYLLKLNQCWVCFHLSVGIFWDHLLHLIPFIKGNDIVRESIFMLMLTMEILRFHFFLLVFTFIY